MSSPIKKYSPYYEYENYGNYQDFQKIQPKKRILKVKKRKKAKKNLIASIFALSILTLYGYYICPYNYKHYFRPLVLNHIKNKNIKLDAKPYVLPTWDYLYNSCLFDERLFVEKAQKTKEMTEININKELTETKTKLLELFKKYPKLKPSVFVWEYSTSSGFEINADDVYPSASIIKIPIAFELMRLIDKSNKTDNPIDLSDKRTFSEQFRTLGSGDLQYTSANVDYSIDYLANIMIANSDNSATNMLLYEIGGMEGFNRAMRNLGLKITSMGGWLPDIEGYNKTTAREMSTILYNIDNPNYIDIKYKNVLKEYLGNTRNIHLIKEKLPQSAMVLHKTGDIGTMLGDSGIVYTDNGKKYIITILVKRPFNDYSARTLIQDASLLIYDDVKSL